MSGSPAAASAPVGVGSRRQPSKWTLRAAGFAALLITCLFLLRLPSALVPRELNVDESLFLSHAMKFTVDARPWIAADNYSSGPLSSYFISVFLLMGLKPTFVLVHVLASILVCTDVFLAYLTMRQIGSEVSARFALLVLVVFYGLTSSANYLHYSGELLPELLLNLGFYFLVRLLPDASDGHLSNVDILPFLCGIALGAAPWCKVQAAPISLSLWLFALIVIWRSRSQDSTQRSWRLRALALTAGFSMTSITMVAILAECRALREFWHSYIVNNLAFAGSLSFTRTLAHISLLLISPLQQLLLLAVVVGIYSVANTGPPVLSVRERWIWTGILTYLCSALFAVVRVTYLFGHHIVLVVMPIVYMIAEVASQNIFVPVEPPRGRQRLLVSTAAVCLVACLALYAVYAVRYLRMVSMLHGRGDPRSGILTAPEAVRSPEAKNAYDDAESNDAGSHSGLLPPYIPETDEKIFAVVQRILLTRPLGSVAIWGWQPGVYVLNGIPPDTRYADMNFVISRGPVQTYYRTNFLNDLRANPPELFIDAVAPGAFASSVNWTDDDGYESYPELRAFIDSNYVLVDRLVLTRGAKPVRFFTRRHTAEPH